jgi:hypothetical protein
MAKKAASRPNLAVAKKRQTVEVTLNEALTHQAIAKRAFELYQLRGETQGDAESDWLRAETELRSAQL